MLPAWSQDDCNHRMKPLEVQKEAWISYQHMNNTLIFCIPADSELSVGTWSPVCPGLWESAGGGRFGDVSELREQGEGTLGVETEICGAVWFFHCSLCQRHSCCFQVIRHPSCFSYHSSESILRNLHLKFSYLKLLRFQRALLSI